MPKILLASPAAGQNAISRFSKVIGPDKFSFFRIDLWSLSVLYVIRTMHDMSTYEVDKLNSECGHCHDNTSVILREPWDAIAAESVCPKKCIRNVIHHAERIRISFRTKKIGGRVWSAGGKKRSEERSQFSFVTP